MKKKSVSPWAQALAAHALAAVTVPAMAQAPMQVPTPAPAPAMAESQLAPVVVTGTRSPLDPDLPNTTASRSREELREQNLFNPEDALRYLPSTTVRKRYIGDRNALIGGRSFTSIQAARGLVFMDGYLLSNFLGRFDAPRWNMVAPEEIERVDVLYGPYSALYPGNSIGTTVAITTRLPKTFEASARVTGATQRYEEYGHADHYGAWQTSAFVGDRMASGLSYSVSVNHQDSTSQPMQYYTLSRGANGAFPAVAPGPTVPVTGVHYDVDPKGAQRAVFGANSGAIDRTVQDLAKLRLGYALSPDVVLEGFVAGWDNDTRNTNRTFLRDAAGQPVWSGLVSNGGNVFSIPASAFAPSARDERHLHAGLTLKTRHATGWNGSLVLSAYRIQEDRLRQADQPDPAAAAGGAGSLTQRGGTGWRTFEAQATYTPRADDWGGGRHALVAGLHHNSYRLRQSVLTLPDWRGEPAGAPTQEVAGQTRLTALYAQDSWRFAEDWKATFGLRTERWETFDGRQSIAGTTPLPPYPARSITAHSPKLALAWTPAADWLLRASVGRGVRFPTVVELYQGSRTGSRIEVNDPNLRPEKSNAVELAAERSVGAHQLRASLFQENIRDTIFSQTNTAVVPNVTNVQNVGKVRARGLELAWSAADWLVKGLRLEANASWVDARTLESLNLESIGKRWVRVPRTRANFIAAYAPSERWSASLALRHSGRQYNELDNSDVNPDVFGGVSSYTLADLRVSVKPTATLELAMGIDNLSDKRTYLFHPLPGRTLFTELRWQH